MEQFLDQVMEKSQGQVRLLRNQVEVIAGNGVGRPLPIDSSLSAEEMGVDHLGTVFLTVDTIAVINEGYRGGEVVEKSLKPLHDFVASSLLLLL